jgi:hypothetical protein
MCRVIPLDAHRKTRQGAAERGASGRATVEPPLPAASLNSSTGPTLRGRIVKRGKPHAAFNVARAGNVARSRYCDTRRRKGEPTGNTNIDLHQRASPRRHLGGPGGETPLGYSPFRSQ